MITQLLNSLPEPGMILNRERQVVYANDKLLAALSKTAPEVIGFRPGELFNCVHAREMAGGCGTSRFCVQCGGRRGFLASMATAQPQAEECRITCATETRLRALDFQVWVTPLACDGQFTVFAIRDTTDEKRRAVLERLFFHDVLNAAGGLQGILDLWPDLSREETVEMSALAKNLADKLA